MKTKTLALIILVFVIISCSKNETTQNNLLFDKITELDGYYVGLFERNTEAADVQLTLIGGTYRGASSSQNFPTIPNGTFTITDNADVLTDRTITFKTSYLDNSPDYDWTLTLRGEWNYVLDNNVLTMTNALGDKYTLLREDLMRTQ